MSFKEQKINNITEFISKKSGSNHSDSTTPILNSVVSDSLTSNENYQYKNYINELVNQDEYQSDDKEKMIMNNNDILKSYIDKMDRDQYELKQDIREREDRINKNISESEHRMDERLDRIENMIREQNSEYSNKVDYLSNKFEQSMKEIKSDKKQMIAIVIATVISVAGVAIAAIQVVQGFLSIIH